MPEDIWSMMTHDDSVSTICATVSRRFSSVSEPIQKPCKCCFGTAMSSLHCSFYTHAVSRDRMAAAGKMLTALLSHAAGQSGPKAASPRIAPAKAPQHAAVAGTTLSASRHCGLRADWRYRDEP